MEDKNKILDAINYINSIEYKMKLDECINPYGDGKASERICDILKNIELTNDLLNKRFFELM